jgi:hypothetical protein
VAIPGLPHDPYGRSLRIWTRSFGSMKVIFLKFLFRLVDLLVNMWLWYAFFLLILPLLRMVNLLAAPRHVFTFGMVHSPEIALGKRAPDGAEQN